MLKLYKKFLHSTFLWNIANWAAPQHYMKSMDAYVITIHDWHSNHCTLIICLGQDVLPASFIGYLMIFAMIATCYGHLFQIDII